MELRLGHRQSFIPLAAAWALLPVLLILSCKETLPSYVDPSQLLEAGSEVLYVFSPSQNALQVNLNLTNKFDETLQDAADIVGSVVIEFVRDPSIRKTFILTAADIATTTMYDANRKTLRVDPERTLQFSVSWNFVDDKGFSVPSGFQYYIDNACSQRCVAFEEAFTVTAELKVFNRIPSARFGPVRASLCYVKNWVDRATCPGADTSIPCSLIPPANPVPCPGNVTQGLGGK